MLFPLGKSIFYARIKVNGSSLFLNTWVSNMIRKNTNTNKNLVLKKKVIERWGVRFTGLVQGVGFRPFISVLAHELGLVGFVYNDNNGVYAEVQGPVQKLEQFLNRVKNECPRLGRLDDIGIIVCASLDGKQEFTIQPSPNNGKVNTFISADTAPCSECLKELKDPNDRRYEYSFINCTHCGPRYTIIQSMPYDRERTTMSSFPMCDACNKEYKTITGRRYHAEPNACSLCGPSYSLLHNDGSLFDFAQDKDIIFYDSSKTIIKQVPVELIDDSISRERKIFAAVRQIIDQGGIVAMKGIGGYHLVCDGRNKEAVKRLRMKKNRPHKPLALMAGSLEAIHEVAYCNNLEQELLESPAHPIVLLEKRSDSEKGSFVIDDNPIAPGNHYWGIMLPYAPVHHVLLPKDALWVMTSGNHSGEPLLYDDKQALEELKDIADYFLVHNRTIHAPVDDSIMAIIEDKPLLYRRSRGFVPESIYCKSFEKKSLPTLLAMGGDLKNAFALNRDHHVFLGPHIGDVQNEKINRTLRETINHFENLFDIVPEYVVIDKHPAYYSSQIGRAISEKLNIPLLEVQHHHAHVAATMAEYNLQDSVLGICFDGTGYGEDGTMWGGEFLLSQGPKFTRLCHLQNIPLPGGEKAVSEPWRQALWYLRNYFGQSLPSIYEEWLQKAPKGGALLDQALQSSMTFMNSCGGGRLFDAVGALLGLGYCHSFDGQIAMALEQAAYGYKGRLQEFAYDGAILDMTPTVNSLLDQYSQGASYHQCAANFHRTLAYAMCEVAEDLCKHYNINHVVLSGGVFQNRRLLEEFSRIWSYTPYYISQQVPCNDGGLALGQWWLGQQIVGKHQL